MVLQLHGLGYQSKNSTLPRFYLLTVVRQPSTRRQKKCLVNNSQIQPSCLKQEKPSPQHQSLLWSPISLNTVNVVSDCDIAQRSFRIPHPWKCSRPNWVGPSWVTWSNGGCPCPRQRGWNSMIFKVASNTNHSVTLWISLKYVLLILYLNITFKNVFLDTYAFQVSLKLILSNFNNSTLNNADKFQDNVHPRCHDRSIPRPAGISGATHTGRWAAAEDQVMGKLSSSVGNTLILLLYLQLLLYPNTKSMPGNTFSLRAIPLCSLYRS